MAHFGTKRLPGNFIFKLSRSPVEPLPDVFVKTARKVTMQK